MYLHRNSPKRFYLKDAIYFVTTNTYEKYPYFKDEVLAEITISNLLFFKKQYKFLLFGFVLMLDHFHGLIQPRDDYSISKIMQSFKKSSSRDINNYVGAIHESRLRRGKQYSFHLNKTYNIPKVKEKSHNGFGQPRLRRRFKWQTSFYDHIIRDEKDFYNHLNYIKDNPVKAGLADDYRLYQFSSFNKKWQNVVDKFII